MSHYGPGPAGTTRHAGLAAECLDPECAPPRTAAATAARMRGREERAAALLRERGWLAIPPEYVKIKDDSVGVSEGALLAGAGRG